MVIKGSAFAWPPLVQFCNSEVVLAAFLLGEGSLIARGTQSHSETTMRKPFYAKTIVILTAMLGLSGHSLAEQPSSKGPTTPRPDGDSDRATPVPQPTIVEGPYYGGSGGAPSDQFCRHPYGIRVDTSTSGVLRFGLRCTNDTETRFGDLFPVGLPGAPLGRIECNEGFEIAGFQGRAGTLIDAVGLICRPLDLSKRELQGTTRIDGGSGGVNFSWECPKSFHLAGVRLRSGSQLDGIQPICEHD